MKILRVIKCKTSKLFLTGIFVFSCVVGMSYFSITPIQAAGLEIIQNTGDESIPLKPFIYIGEEMDWDVKRDGLLQGGMVSQGYRWSSSNTSVVAIKDIDNDDCTGILIAKAKGTATITLRYEDGRTATASIQVKQPATSVSLSKTAEDVYIGKPATLTATINPSTTNDKANGVTWTSSNTGVATVDSTGKVTAKKNGVATITATFTNKDRFGSTTPATVSNTCKVTVKTKVTGINVLDSKSKKITNKEFEFKRKTKYSLKYLISPSTASNRNVTWSTSNGKIVKVNSKGVMVTQNKYGEATITVTSKDGNKKASIKIIVPRNIKGTLITNNYVYNFTNLVKDNYFFKGKQKRNYSIYKKDRDKLIKSLTQYYKNKDYIYNGKKYKVTNETVKRDVNSVINTKWGGSCFGMSMTIALNRSKQINVKKYTKSKGKAYRLNKVKAPKNNSKVKNIINYYQVLTPYYINDYRVEYKVPVKNWNKYKKGSEKYKKAVEKYKSDSKKWKSGLVKIVATSKKKQLQSFDFYKSSEGHAILIKKYVKYDSEKKRHVLLTYDSNYPKKKTYLYIGKKYTTLKVQNYNWKIKRIDVLSNYKEYDYVRIDK